MALYPEYSEIGTMEMTNATVDMTYRFLRDSEPTDEQLQVIMEEVAEEARRGQEEIAKQILENINRENIQIRAVLQAQAQ
jgi:hypothetical protein